MTPKVQVWLFRAGESGSPEVLLLRTTPERGGFWQPVTGSVEPGESNAAAALREAGEETGVRLSMDDVVPVGHVIEFESRWGGRAREEVFVARVCNDVLIEMDPREHVEFKWVEASQADSLLKHEETKICLERASKFF